MLVVFTLPIWMGTGLVLIIYGWFTGIFKKEMEQIPTTDSYPISPNQQTENTQTVINPKKNIIAISLLFLGIFLIVYFTYFGGIYPCVYTYKKVAEQKFPIGTKVVLSENAYLLKGGNEFKNQHCRWSDGPSFDNNITDKKFFEGCVNCLEIFISSGTLISDLPMGKEFIFVGAYDGIKKGISSIDSGNRPHRYWSLKDENGVFYTLLVITIPPKIFVPTDKQD